MNKSDWKNFFKVTIISTGIGLWIFLFLPVVLNSLELESKQLEARLSTQLLLPESTARIESTAYYSPGLLLTAAIDPQTVAEREYTVAKCSDCKYFPVSKINGLPASYVPQLVETNLPGGGSLTLETVQALRVMFEAMNRQGLKPKINSAYRSYQEQLSTFNFWVQREIKSGKDLNSAEEAANKYSAKPGHSEHQLGTTLDVNCSNCGSFDTTNITNLRIWSFIEREGHKYGFVISYPRDSETQTGYVYEPWHIRYVGIDLATELYNLGYLDGKRYYLQDILSAKKLWLDM